ncbi:MutS-related protein [Thermovenabulum gondwanense]|uniref:DNA mismatch repair protein MutS n=1 Tax=Thermovenabulum gondwanense TaxID=520767 RepID=A0A161PU00_9FIRM|nr:DNA mismatch repair protein MutS [Thermovenabulum gondwanense]KYO65511.1 DNA mismatch repair protein MutS [Thermovenabulum gondwanense]
MKVYLMYKDHNFDFQQKLPWNEQILIQDLELNTLFNAMALGDKFLFEVAKKAVLSGLNSSLDTILYRQDILRDCFKNSFIVRNIYNIAVESIEREKKHYFGIFSKYPEYILDRSIEVLQMFMEMLKKLKTIADEHADKFESEGFTAFFTMLKEELDDEFFDSVQNHLKELKFDEGILISAELGKGNKGINYTLRKPKTKKQSWIERFFIPKTPIYSFQIHSRDESGARALSELKERGINLVANALAQSNDHILGFFNVLRTELAFYIGCLNLYEQLSQIGEPVCFPLPVASYERKSSFKGLYDVSLALTMKQKIVDNDLNADNKDLVIITGANQGGKSTFLRSIGLAQLMMQCGMFVPAEYFCANICDGLFTHYKRKEDATMKSGKLDEELSRMRDIVEHITPNSIVLFNESFAATNEREGSEIARQIICALLEKGIKIFFVTHLYEFAHSFCEKKMKNVIFLRAERQNDGKRTFKIIEGEPLQTSFGEDLYNRIFGTDKLTRC